MKTDTKYLTRYCNLHCAFCGLHETAPGDFLPLPGLLAEIDDFRREGGEVLTLSGGEPALHPDFPDILAGIQSKNGLAVVLETNGTVFSQPERAPLAKEHGLKGAVVLFISHTPEISVLVTRKKGAYDAVVQGISNLLEAGIAVHLQIPLLTWNLPHLEEMFRWLVAKWPGLEGVTLVLLNPEKTPEQGRAMIPRFSQLGGALAKALPVMASAGKPVRLHEGHGIPFCTAAGLQGFPALFDTFPHTRGNDKGTPVPGYSQGLQCSGCPVKLYCPGFPDAYTALFGDGDFRPLDEAAFYSWQALLYRLTGPDEGLYDMRLEAKVFGAAFKTYVIRINAACNMDCTHCWVDQARPDTPEDLVYKQIKEAVRRGFNEIAFSGGEPTLIKALPEYIAAARKQGGAALFIELQTNAVRCDHREYVDTLVAAGLDKAFISLLAPTTELYDEITLLEGYRNGFERTLTGIHNFADAGVRTAVNHVINTQNAPHIIEFAHFFVREFGRHIATNPIRLNVCVAQPINPKVLEQRWVIPRFRDFKDSLLEALDYLLENGIEVSGLNSISGVPHCVLDGDARFFPSQERVVGTAMSEIYEKLPCCAECSRNEYCQGVRKNYIALYGPEEFRAVQ